LKTIIFDKNKIEEFCNTRHITKLAVFGSVLREDFNESSDIDILVEFEKDHVPGYFTLFDIEDELSDLFGVKADVRTPEDLSRYFRDDVLNTMEVKYEARR
jgi:predicted nucleotidyltransferase